MMVVLSLEIALVHYMNLSFEIHKGLTIGIPQCLPITIV